MIEGHVADSSWAVMISLFLLLAAVVATTYSLFFLSSSVEVW